MLDTSHVNERIAAARAFAASVELLASLEHQLSYLEHFVSYDRTRCTLYPDRAPFSFTFRIEIRRSDDTWEHLLEGSLVFHGPHDGFGSGRSTTAFVAKPTLGWCIHT